MATMVLTSAGSAVAGPFGAALGGYLGRSVEGALNGPNAGQSPTDLRLQSSRFGNEIPAIYGQMRVSGTVIWASDLFDTAKVSKSGARNSFSVSFALALSSKRISNVGRIWADNRLIRGIGGDHKIPFKFRLHHGSEDQEADPLIASHEGVDRTPAFRGISVLLLEDFDLSSFGNRLPHITVEVMAIGAHEEAGRLAADSLGVSLPAALSRPEVLGYALEGDTVAQAVAPLLGVFSLPVAYRLHWEFSEGVAHHDLHPDDIEYSTFGLLPEGISNVETPTSLSLRYFEPAADYAIGEKAARLPAQRPRQRLLNFPGVLTSDSAKRVARHHLASVWNQRQRRTVLLPVVRARDICLGDSVSIAGERAKLRITQKIVNAKGLLLGLVEQVPFAQPEPTDSGVYKTEEDKLPTDLQLRLMELPQDDGKMPKLGVALSGGVKP